MNVLSLNEVSYRYGDAKSDVLKGVSAEFEAGKVYTIVGKSGSGKTTLLSLMAGLDICSGGQILFDGSDLKIINRDSYRARGIGVIFQGYNLITGATAAQNVVLSMNISKSPVKDKKAHAYALLEQVGIDRETADRPVLKLSGGEQQRVGIARALSHDPPILIADEPTGNLDKETAEEILDIFTDLARTEGRCVIIVTHSHRVTEIADVVLRIRAGRLTAIRSNRDRSHSEQ